MLFLIGFGIWNIDNVYCHHLRTWRDYVLLPWAIVLEGHGWWHLFTGLGGKWHVAPVVLTSQARRASYDASLTKMRVLGYYFITWRIWLHRCLEGSENEFALQWPSPLTSIPRVVPHIQD